jgi:hypothetical protein
MRRTNIYLTDEQQRHIGAKARVGGVSKAEVVRRLLDSALGIGDGEQAAEAAVEASFGIWADRPDQEIAEALAWRSSDRFERLGL